MARQVRRGEERLGKAKQVRLVKDGKGGVMQGRQGAVGHGKAGEARLGLARSGEARQVWSGKAWRGLAW